MKKLLILLLIIVIASAAKQSLAQTNVSGGIYANTTWTLAGSPYIVTGTVVVFPGYTLTIDPGVTVKFDNAQGLELRGSSLIALGTVIDSITFTSSSASPTAGIWDKVWRSQGTMPLRINYCIFKYASYAISGADTIRNSTFSFNVNGGGGSFIDSCIYTYNTEVGMAGSNANHCKIMHNKAGFESGWIMNSRIDSNQTGVGTVFSSGWYRVVNCTINHNQTGIIRGMEQSSYLNCIIDSNSVTGVELEMGDSLYNCEVKGNTLGVDGTYSQSLISRNVIENNTTGILVGGYGNTIYCNKICNNSTYDLKMVTASALNVANNYWCTPDSISTTLRIYDGYDDASLGLVTFMPLDQSNCYLTGCNLNVTATVTNATCSSCTNGSSTANMTFGFPPYTYTWYTTPVQTTQTATGLASGTYTICVTDGHGCTACNYSIFVDSTNCTGFSINASSTNASCSSCSDGVATVTTTGGHAPFSYTWYTSPMQNTQTATGLPVGTYAVCVNDVYGCTLCDTVTIGIGNCSAYYTIVANGAPHTYDLTNLASGNPPLTYDWDWNDGSPHDNTPYPTHTYAASGNYNICLSISDNSGCSDTYCHSFYLLSPLSPVLINVIPPTTTGINEAANAKAFSIYPNPANSTLTIQSKEAIENIIIRSIDGRVVKSLVIGHWSLVEIDLGDLSSGIYFIEVNKSSRQRFVKQ